MGGRELTMARHIWSILCRRVITDRESNTSSYIDALEEFVTSGVPVRVNMIMIGTLWAKANEEEDLLEVRVRVLSPAGHEIHVENGPEVRFGNFRRFRLNLGVLGLPIDLPGVYEFCIEHRQAARWI